MGVSLNDQEDFLDDDSFSDSSEEFLEECTETSEHDPSSMEMLINDKLSQYRSLNSYEKHSISMGKP